MSAPRAGRLAALFGLLAGAALASVMFAPARWLGNALAWASADRVQVLNAQGTVWNGHADLVLSAGQGSLGRTALPQGLRWKTALGWEDGGPALRLILQAPCCTRTPIQATVRPGGDGLRWRLAAFDSQWPAALLSGLGTPWNTLQPEGLLRLQSPGLAVGPAARGTTQWTGSLEVQALRLSSRVSTLRPLGSYRLRIDPLGDEGPGSRIALDTLEGGLLLQGDGRWDGTRLRFSGDARAAPGREAALANLLNIIGRRDGARAVLSFG